ncbi:MULTISPECIES: radical SAM/SPASM domain-containing protein [unclassified Fusibacter]|uniref:radical SAM/SPASM domain-containing protein n=1 Tax=unclassified Fusibacter TaxID=2624464 RepID=UPI0010127DC9|nr:MULTISPECIES: radical SAM/SPASM domain-containing protein [unclassified Fusibacter]MCK8060638.1 radical SAM protein [Fusibacter sp. A2]NPE22908.1 radical SAM protein [Fusibacter sp. A1]RXV59976.1 radical SAM protein [Fusibacter sp. A1]
MKKFKRIFIEISNVCNLACSFCPPSDREGKTMSADDFETVLKKLEGHGEHVYLHIKGEPLLHSDFKKILDLCRVYKKKVNITTNGTLLDKEGQAILDNPAVRLVNISLQSFEEMDNESSYEAYLKKVLSFVKKGLRDTKILFDLRLWNFDDSSLTASKENQRMLDHIEAFLDLPEPITVTDSKTKGNKLSSNVYISKGSEFEWPSMNREEVATRGTCYGLRHQIGILSTGVVVPCCLDAEGAVPLGNILEDDFENIVTSDRATAIARGFENNKLVEALCRRCAYRERFF